jgi:hypothetical protein
MVRIKYEKVVNLKRVNNSGRAVASEDEVIVEKGEILRYLSDKDSKERLCELGF